jgi:hypothetical protein
MIPESVKTEGRIVWKGKKEATCTFRYEYCHIKGKKRSLQELK